MFTFIETRTFSRLVQEYLSDDEYSALQTALIRDPNAGSVIPGSGGVRKLRWGARGRGKRGGYRIIYYVRRMNGIIWMLTIYRKKVTGAIPFGVLKEDPRGDRRWLKSSATSERRYSTVCERSSAAGTGA